MDVAGRRCERQGFTVDSGAANADIAVALEFDQQRL